jgi:hypothetical protein
MYKRNQSAAKPLKNKYGESSQTISKESTLNDNSGSGEPLPSKVEGDDIVESKSKTFIEKSVKLHGDRYSYINVNYVNAKKKVKIMCQEHGEFEQTPDKHLNTIHCCPVCNLNRKKKAINNVRGKKPIESYETFLIKLYNKFPEVSIKLVDNWSGITKTNVIVNCEIHGEKTVNCEHLISSLRVYSCSNCASENRTKNKCHDKCSIVTELKTKCGDYEYIFPVDYKTKRDKIKVICPIHGEFNRSVQKLLSGQYCSRCRVDKLIDSKVLVGGYNEDLFNNNPKLKDKSAILYFLKINNGELFKIGITTNVSPKKRISVLKNKSKQFIKTCDIIATKELTLYEAYTLEQIILEENKNFRVKRRWSTELFNKDISCNVLQYFT